MNTKTTGLMALALATALSTGELTAQERGRRADGPAMRGSSIERVMALRDRLELTEAQIATLDGIRAEEVRRRSELRAELEEMRSRVQAGQARRSEMMALMEDRRDAREAEVASLRERLEAVLEPGQLEELEQIRSEARAFERGRRAGRAGMRGRVGLGRGSAGMPGRFRRGNETPEVGVPRG